MPKADKRLYGIWRGIKKRCYNPNAKEYINYGGRGITVCDEWLNDFIGFRKWAIENNYAEHLTIDRIDNDGNYTPENCRWATMKEQANNRRAPSTVKMNGMRIRAKRPNISPPIDLTGRTFERLKVLGISGRFINKKGESKGILWFCQCKCGNFKTASTNDLTSGHIKSCGCLKSDTA